MAAGDPFASSVIDEYLDWLVKQDLPMKEYAPGGYSPVDPGSDTKRPIVRSWQHTPGEDDILQDGSMSRAQSNPRFVVCMLDEQTATRTDHVYGSVGGQFRPKKKHMLLGALRLYKILHNRSETFECGGYTYEITSKIGKDSTFRRDDLIGQGKYEAMEGHMVQFWVC